MKKFIKEIKKSVDGGELYYLESESTPVKFKNSKLYSIEHHADKGIALRVIKDGKLGFSLTNRLEDTKTLLNNALETAKLGKEVKYKFPSPSRYRKNLKIWYSDVKALEVKNMVEIGHTIVDELSKKAPDLKIDVEMEKIEENVRIINSSGLDLDYKKTYFSIFAVGFGLIENSFTWIYDGFWGSRLPKSINPILKTIIRLYKNSKKISQITSGKMEVIFMPTVLPSLLRSFELGVNGKNIKKGTSPLKDKLGKKLLDKRVSIIDNPLREGAANTIPVDGEGIPTKKKFIFRDGRLENFILDLDSASFLGMEPTGNGLRRGLSTPSPGTTNVEISPGDVSLNDMIKSVNDGLIIYGVLGGGQSNLLAGDFSVNVSLGFRIKSGEIIGRVKNTMVSGNVYELFNNIKAISKGRKEFMGILTPAILFKNVNVTG